MLRANLLRLGLALVLAVSTWAAALHAYRNAMRVTFSRDVAPITYAHCASCHRPGQAGPFSLLTYAQCREHARDMANVVGERYMPPWKPSDRNHVFVGQRTLTEDEIATIQSWVKDGKLEGDPHDLPVMPSWPKDWQLGTPDAVVTIEAPYPLAASGGDDYRDFVIAAPVKTQKYVVGWEFRGESRAIHHAILKIDRMGNARRADAADPGPGFSAMDFDGAQAPDGFYLVWAPGKVPVRATDGTAWRIEPGADLLLELHMQRTGKPEMVRPKIALYFSDTPPTQRRFSMRIGDGPIDIAPGQTDFRMTDTFTLPADTRILGMFPHAHYLGKKVRVFSRLPDGHELELLRIDDWDFNWQDEYTFVTPPILPKGSTLQLELSYDNSAKNIRNPNHPPARVQGGTRSIDEMGNVTFQAMPVRPQDFDLLIETKFRRQIARGAGAQAHYNLANTLVHRGAAAEAKHEYLEALAVDPKLAPAHFNLATLLLGENAFAEAIPQLEAVLVLRPDDTAARLALGHALVQVKRVDEAIAQYRRVTSEHPDDARAHVMLGDALRTQGKTEEARAQYEASLQLMPDWAPARDGLAALAN